MPADDYIQELERGQRQVEQFGRTVTQTSQQASTGFRKIATAGKEASAMALEFHPATVALASFVRHTGEATKGATTLKTSLEGLTKGAAKARVEIAQYRLLGQSFIQVGQKMQTAAKGAEQTSKAMTKLGGATKWVGDQFKWIAPNADEAAKATARLTASQYGLLRAFGKVGGQFSKVFLGPVGTGIAAVSLSYELFIKKAIASSEQLEAKLKDVAYAIEAAGGRRGAGLGEAAIIAEAALTRGGSGRIQTAEYLAGGVRRGFSVRETGRLVEIARVIAAEQNKTLAPVLETVLARASIQRAGLTARQREEQILDWRLRAGPIRAAPMGPMAAAGQAFTQFGTQAGALTGALGLDVRHLAERIAGPYYRGEAHPIRSRLADTFGGYGRGIFSPITGALGAGVTALSTPFLTGAGRLAENILKGRSAAAAGQLGIPTRRPAPPSYMYGVAPGYAQGPGVEGSLFGGVSSYLSGAFGSMFADHEPGAPRLRTPGSLYTPSASEARIERIGGHFGESARVGRAAEILLHSQIQQSAMRGQGLQRRAGELYAEREEAILTQRLRTRLAAHGTRGQDIQRRLAALAYGAEGRAFTPGERKQAAGISRELETLMPEERELARISGRNLPLLGKSMEELREIIDKTTVAYEKVEKEALAEAETRVSLGAAYKRLTGERSPLLAERAPTPGEIFTEATRKEEAYIRAEARMVELDRKRGVQGGYLSQPELQELKAVAQTVVALKGEMEKFNENVKKAGVAFESVAKGIGIRQRREVYPAATRVQLRGLVEEGAITGGEAGQYMKYVKAYVDNNFKLMRTHLDQLLSMRKAAYDEEIQATSQFADLRLRIIADHYQGIIKLERARLTAGDRQDRFRLGYLQQVAGIEDTRIGIGGVLRGAAGEQESRAIERERFGRGQLQQLMGLSGVPMPRGMQIAFGLREMQIAQQERGRREEERAAKIADAIDKFANIMDQGREVGLGPQRLMQSAAGRQFYSQQLQQLLPAAARVGFGGSVAGRLRGVLDVQQRYAFQQMQFGEQERELQLAQSGAQLTELGRQFEGREDTQQYLYRRAQLLRGRRDLLAAAGRPQEAATVQREFMNTYAQLSDRMQKALTNKQEAIRVAVENQTQVVRAIYSFLTGKGGPGRTGGAPAGAPREYGQLGPGTLPGGAALVGGPFEGVTPYKPSPIEGAGRTGPGFARAVGAIGGGLPLGRQVAIGEGGRVIPIPLGQPTAQDSPDEWSRKFLAQPHVRRMMTQRTSAPLFGGRSMADYMQGAGAAWREAFPSTQDATAAQWGIATEAAHSTAVDPVEATRRRIAERSNLFTELGRIRGDYDPVLKSPDLPPERIYSLPGSGESGDAGIGSKIDTTNSLLEKGFNVKVTVAPGGSKTVNTGSGDSY